jgi:hypothetical protein
MRRRRRAEMGPYDEDDRYKLSWREIDQRRDRSRHVSGGKSYKERAIKSDWARKQHLREAEKFFQGKKGTEAYKRAYAALHEKFGTSGFKEAAQQFIQAYGLPEDWGTLLLLMDSSEPDWVKEAADALKGMYGRRSPMEQKGFKGKLKIQALTAKDKDLRREAERILEEL